MTSKHRSVEIDARGEVLRGILFVPRDPAGLVLFAHGSGSSRFSQRNRRVASVLEEARFATLLIDLLTDEEEADERGARRFDVDRLAERLALATEWLCRAPSLAHLGVAYFGSSTGAAAALLAASRHPGIAAVVSRGGRPDLAARALPYVRAPTLLIVGGADRGVLQLNRDALEELGCERRLEVVPGATHLFEEPGALDRVAELARDWLTGHRAGREEAPRV
jgi:dienelactone hydrolase